MLMYLILHCASNMIGLFVLVVLLAFYVICQWKKAYERHENFPPGPPSLPIYGAYWIIVAKAFNNLALATIRLAKEYNTKLVGLYLGPIPQVLVNDSTLIKEVLIREEFDGRLDTVISRARGFWKKLGIFFTDGFFWHTQRRFSLRYMRDWGFGRRCKALEDTITHDTKEMIEMVLNGTTTDEEKKFVNGDLIYLPHFFDVPFVNGLLQVFVQKTFSRNEYTRIWGLGKSALKFQRSTNDLGGALVITPWIKNILPNMSGYNDLTNGTKGISDFYGELIKDAIETYEDTHERHFFDAYIKKMKQEIAENQRTTYSAEQLQLICTDYTFPTASATEMTLTLLLERILIQPELQDKIHEELDSVVGRDRMPTLDDRQNLPFTEACIREILRFETLVPLGVPHRAMKDTTLGGYNIPEGTSVAVNLVTLHMDEKIWGDPQNFRPERFIVDGKLQVSLDKSLPFGAGRRLCAGETYARHSMFLIFAAFMQAFQVSTADGKPLTRPAKRIQGIITTIPEFWIRVTPRIG
ncbi:probable cytochrome P450 304a1 [Pieris rapae]|uniref:probable cytochrome P450 304a1 n=1 Tax=Pieris rapae TaxID=64459 RepID=UPI001E27B53B|nr:probable cytochrome P450 304a1 [Pieris rapae]